MINVWPFVFLPNFYLIYSILSVINMPCPLLVSYPGLIIQIFLKDSDLSLL